MQLGPGWPASILALVASGCLSPPPDSENCAASSECLSDSRFPGFADRFVSDELVWAMTWTTAEDPQSTVRVDGELVVTPSGLPGDYVGVTTAPVDFRGRRVTVEVTAMTNAAATSCETWLGLSSEEDSLLFFQEDGRLHMPGLATSVPYHPVEHRWWQIVADDVISFQVSADGVFWCELSSVPAPSWISGATFELGAGSFLDESDHVLGSFTVDNLNLPPDRCNTPAPAATSAPW